MVQRILEPGQIETLAQRSIPRVRLPDRAQLFAHRAARLRQLAEGAAIGDYLRFIGAIAEAQHTALGTIEEATPDNAHLDRTAEHSMPPINATSWARPPQWREVLDGICAHIAARSGLSPGVASIVAHVRSAPHAWMETQADALLAAHHETVEPAAAPLVMASLQVCWVALSSGFVADKIRPLDVAGLCPLCGSLPVASIVRARSPYQGYRYLHCSLCASEWHMVRVQCSQCGAVGKDIGYHHLGSEPIGEQDRAYVRAESCEHCHAYRKIVYEEKDPDVEPLADDLASLALDLLLGEHGYHRASGNPMLWHSGGT